jgi:predicted RNase H-like HicB family nuclease
VKTALEQLKKMNDSARYIKIVEWSDEDCCYIGSSPGLFRGGCHGNDERQVFDELCTIVEGWIELYRRDGKPLPPPTANRGLVNKLSDAA